MLLGQQREPYRDVFFAVWQKVLIGTVDNPPELEPMEQIIAALIGQHPEYHAVFEHPEQHAHAEFPANNLYDNPFLHISMHLGLIEQLRTDRPVGIQPCYERLLLQAADEHQLQHQIMDIMAAHLWDAMNNNMEVDEQKMLEAIKKLA